MTIPKPLPVRLHEMAAGQSAEEMEAHMAKVTKGPYGFLVMYPNGRDVSLGIVKTVIHFRNVTDIGEKDLDSAVFQYAEFVKLAEWKTLPTH